MTLTEYIKELQKLAKRKGLKDAELIFSADDEGNNYQKLSGLPTLVFVEQASSYYIEDIYYEVELDELEMQDLKKVILIN